MKKILFILIFIISFHTSFSQYTNELKKVFFDAEYYVLYEDYNEAVFHYLKLLNNGIDNAYINHRIGECYLQIPGQKAKSIPYLEEACKNISSKFKEGSLKETNAPTRTLFYLGNAYQINNQLDKAIVAYEKFEKSLDVQDIYNIDYVYQQIRSCNNAKELMNKPIKIKESNIGEKINDRFSNIRPVISSDEKSIIYLSNLKFYDAIFYANKTKNEWSGPINITPDIQSDGDYYPTFLSSDGESLLLNRNENYTTNIYDSKFENGKWQLPKKLNKNINTKYQESGASFTSDKKELYFVSNRKDGNGGFDIYKSIFNEELNDWGEAINLGPEINTPFNEETPIISEDGNTLFFCSQGHYNMGGFDIFYSTRISENEWSTPVNIGYPINTTDDNIYFYPVDNGNYAYISKFVKNGYGKEDIIRIEIFSPDHPFLINVRGSVSLQDNQIEFLKKNFQVNIQESNKILKTIHLNETNGDFSTELSPGLYEFIFKSKDYKQVVKTINIPKSYSRDELVFNVELIPTSISTGEYISIKSLNFGFDDCSLSKDSKIELERIYNLMMKYTSLNIEVIGHTDAVGSADYNKKLSIKRAKSAINYLIGKGIKESRFVARGAGKDEPLAINTNAEGRKFNRRVELKVLNSDNNLIISQDHNIPEHLKKFELTYCILLSVEKQKLPEDYFDYFDEFDEFRNYEVQKHKGKKFIYTLGNNPEKSELIEIFNSILDLGFNDAKIISSYDLEKLLR